MTKKITIDDCGALVFDMIERDSETDEIIDFRVVLEGNNIVCISDTILANPAEFMLDEIEHGIYQVKQYRLTFIESDLFGGYFRVEESHE